MTDCPWLRLKATVSLYITRRYLLGDENGRVASPHGGQRGRLCFTQVFTSALYL